MGVDIKYCGLELMIRVFCAILFIFQGYDKLFKIGFTGVKETFYREANKKQVPHLLVDVLVYYTSIIEFLGGIFLLVGLFQNTVLMLLGIDLILVGLAFSYLEPMWDMKHVLPRLILVAMLMAMPSEWSFFSIKTLVHYLLK